MNDGELWSFFRSLLYQGMAIQMDYSNGKYDGYERLSARLDEAARERVYEFNRPAQGKQADEAGSHNG